MNINQIAIVIFVISSIVWLIPPFKQKGTEYFIFFFIYAIHDPLIVLLLKILKIRVDLTLVFVITLVIISIMKSKTYATILISISFTAAILIMLYELSATAIHEISIFLYFAMLCIVILRVAEQFMNNKTLNLFLIILIAYVTISMYRHLAASINPDVGIIGYYLGLAIQILFGIAFSFININTKNFMLIKEDKY